ncbi:MAG TPA: polysaccharide deacetylase family protein [Bacillota bacterium]|nr:polysaccharide deacetylase family protein [Bacillota bacterium]
MNLKKWIGFLLAGMLGCACLLAGMNALIDPFGVFGDKLLNWYSYDMTNNPRVAKIAYLDKKHDKYDSYIIGCSKTSSFPVEKLDEYYGGARFYNMLMYGGDMYDAEKTAEYIIENYNPKNIIINMGLEEAVTYNTETDPLKGNLHAKVDGSSKLKFYFRYLFLHPQYAFDKLQAYEKKSMLPGKDDVFLAESGAYNKSVRDTDYIGTQDEFLAKYPYFNDTYGFNDSLAAEEKCIAAIGKIKALCEEKGITFRLFVSPIYCKEIDTYNMADLKDYWVKLAQVTDFWDFAGYTSVSYEPRYFYDAYHFRNAVGDMALAWMFGDASVYVPPGFGYHVTAENARERAEAAFTPVPEGAQGDPAYRASYSDSVPVLMYHNLGYEDGNDGVITPENFQAQMAALKAAGYHAIFFSQLTDYVEHGTELPDKPVVVTFDDGYESNYTYAWPILRQLGMKATINVIGVSVGKDTYKDTGAPIYPHFTYDQAREMETSGVIDIQSHSYDMHQSKDLEKNGYREGVYPKPGETEEEYVKAFTDDFTRSRAEIEKEVGNAVDVYAYPFGYHTSFAEVLLHRMGVKSTLTVEEGPNSVLKGLPQSILGLKRYNITNRITGEALLRLLEEN